MRTTVYDCLGAGKARVKSKYSESLDPDQHQTQCLTETLLLYGTGTCNREKFCSEFITSDISAEPVLRIRTRTDSH
jgi:hypothetical protein